MNAAMPARKLATVANSSLVALHAAVEQNVPDANSPVSQIPHRFMVDPASMYLSPKPSLLQRLTSDYL